MSGRSIDPHAAMAKHRRLVNDFVLGGQPVCTACQVDQPWPCDAFLLAEALVEALAELEPMPRIDPYYRILNEGA